MGERRAPLSNARGAGTPLGTHGIIEHVTFEDRPASEIKDSKPDGANRLCSLKRFRVQGSRLKRGGRVWDLRCCMSLLGVGGVGTVSRVEVAGVGGLGGRSASSRARW